MAVCVDASFNRYTEPSRSLQDADREKQTSAVGSFRDVGYSRNSSHQESRQTTEKRS